MYTKYCFTDSRNETVAIVSDRPGREPQCEIPSTWSTDSAQMLSIAQAMLDAAKKMDELAEDRRIEAEAKELMA